MHGSVMSADLKEKSVLPIPLNPPLRLRLFCFGGSAMNNLSLLPPAAAVL